MGKIIKNIGWLIFDRIFILVLQFFIGVKIANYYGSSSYGIYSFAVSIVAFSAIFFEILNSRVIKKYYDEEKDRADHFLRNRRYPGGCDAGFHAGLQPDVRGRGGGCGFASG